MKIPIIPIAVLLFATVNLYSQNTPIQEIKMGKDLVINNQTYATQEGFIDVPEDYDDPKSRRLQLPFFIVKSQSKNPAEPIFWLDGGPGSSNILTPKAIASSAPSKLLENHDLVCVGYRGVDGSTILKSKEINKAMSGLHHEMLSDKSLNNIEAKIKEYQIQLKKDGIDINKYTMLDVIEDLEYARKYFGYTSIHLLTVSYGTRVALLYSYKYPEVLKRTVMIGANPPGHFVWFPEKTEQILDLYDSLYTTQNSKVYNGSIKEAMNKAFEKMPKRWSIYKLDADKIKAGTFAALFSTETAPLVFEGYFKAAEKGDYSYLFMAQKIMDMGIGANAIGEMTAKAVSADFERDIDYRKLLKGDNTILGGNISMLYWGIASALQIKMIPEEYRKCRTSSSETLVISGDLDVSTPADYASNELMPFLKNGQEIILKNMSHSDIFKETMKSPDFLSNYFDDGVADKRLLKSSEPINFKPNEEIGKAKIFALGLIK